jgi:predicted lipid-binding transport protein (Tim44 family)
MDMFSSLLEARGKQQRELGAIRPQRETGLAPSPTAPFGDLLDERGRPELPSLGEQDPFILKLALTRLRTRDPGFDPDALATLAADAMVAVERAWSTLDPQPSRAYLAPALWASHRARMELYQLHGRRNVVDDVTVHSSRVVAIEQGDRGSLPLTDTGRDRVTVRIRASSTDYEVDGSGAVVRGDKLVHTWEADWMLERASTLTSRADGGLLGGRCPACGAPLQLDGDGLCSYCHAAVADATHDWVVVAVGDVGREDDVLRAVLGIRTAVRTGDDDMSPADEVVSFDMPLPDAPAATAGDDPLAVLRVRYPALDAAEITVAARTAFVALRTAWGAMDPSPARPVMTASGVDALTSAIAALRERGLRRATDDPLLEKCTVVSATPGDEWASVTVRVVATTVDADVDGGGAAVRGSLQPRRMGSDLVLRRLLHRDGDVSRCPRCGAPLRASVAGVCDFCREAVAGGGGDWLLDSVPELAETAQAAPAAPAAPIAAAAAGTAPAAAPLDALRTHDPDVSLAELLARARECFYAVEGAIARGNADGAAACVSPQFLDGMRATFATLAAAGRHRVLAFIDVEDAELVDAGIDDDGERAVVRIDVSGEDAVIEDGSGAVVEGSAAQRRWSEAWTLRRSGAGATWLVDAVSGPPAVPS